MPEFIVTFEMVDAYNRRTRKVFHTVDTMADYDAAVAAAAGLATDLANLSELDILAYNVSGRTVYTDTVDVGANKDEGVTFTMRKVDNYNDDIKVPGPLNAIFDTNGNVLPANGLVTAFLANFLVGGDFTFSDGEQAQNLVRGSLDK